MTSRSPNIKFVIRAIFVKKGDKKGKKKTLFYKNIFADFRLGWWAGGWVWAVGPVKKLVPIRPLQCWLQKIHHMATLASRQCPHHAGYSVVATECVRSKTDWWKGAESAYLTKEEEMWWGIREPIPSLIAKQPNQTPGRLNGSLDAVCKLLASKSVGCRRQNEKCDEVYSNDVILYRKIRRAGRVRVGGGHR